MHCEISRSPGYDPTGEWAVECGAEGDYCSVCDMVVCPHCHQSVATDSHHLAAKKPPVSATQVPSGRPKAG